MSTANIMVSAALCCPWEQLFYEPALLDSASGDADGNGTVDYYRSIIKPEEIRVLDVGCGTGRLAIPLATDGYEVFAIDSSFEMVAFFQQKLLHLDREIQQRIHLQHLNIQSQICSGNLDVAIAVDDFLTHFLDEVTLGSALQNICHSLRPGGRFLTDLRSRSPQRLTTATQPLPKPMYFFGIVHQVPMPQGERSAAMRSIESYDEDQQILTSTQIFEWILPDGTVEKTVYRTLRQRLHSLATLTAAAQQVGLKLSLAQQRLSSRPGASPETGMSLEFHKP
jgi:SAM-dependent methyltransferase